MIYSFRLTAALLCAVLAIGCASTEYDVRENSYFSWKHDDRTENQWHVAVGYSKELDIIGVPESGAERYPVGFGDEFSFGFAFVPNMGETSFAVRLTLMSAEAVFEGITRSSATILAPAVEITLGGTLFRFHDAVGPTILFGGLSLMPAFYGQTTAMPPVFSTNVTVFSPGGGIVLGLESFLTKDISVILKNTIGVLIPLSPVTFHIYDRVDLGFMCYPW
ncbi:MAG: hypothetical protein AABZ39_14785 [Spirochaetota bacterium]